MTALADAALELAAHGWQVYLVLPQGKSPLIPNVQGGRVVDAHRPQIEAAASALLGKHELDGKAAFAICDAAGPAIAFGRSGRP